MKNMKFIAGLMLMTLGILLITSSFLKAQKSGDFVVPLSEPGKKGKLKVHLNSGTINVKGVPRKDILIKYDDSGKGDHDDDCDGCQDKDKKVSGLKRISGGSLELEITENSNTVTVKSESWNNKVDVEIEVPTGFDLQLHTYNNGNLLVNNIEGAIELTNYNGEIEAKEISGSVVATTYNGDIKLTFTKVEENTPMSFSTYNGDIDLSFPSSLKATLKMKTEQGDIYTAFDVKLLQNDPVQTKDTKSGGYKLVIAEWTKGAVNGGGPEITMKTYNGDIYVRKK